jgi:hypothetical protein
MKKILIILFMIFILFLIGYNVKEYSIKNKANLCYNYETQTTTNICLKEDMLNQFYSTEVCSLVGEKIVNNSVAPIQITELKQTVLGSEKIQIKFTITHIGNINNSFYKLNTDCDDKSINKVFIEIPTKVNENLAQCFNLEQSTGNSGFIILPEGNPKSIICNFNIENISGAFETPLKINLRYRYSPSLKNE